MRGGQRVRNRESEGGGVERGERDKRKVAGRQKVTG